MSTPSATYKSPILDHAHKIAPSSTLPAFSSNSSTDERVAYLAALQSSIKILQADVNTFLTEKMDQDRQIASQTGTKVDDVKEEDNYGEEVVEDE